MGPTVSLEDFLETKKQLFFHRLVHSERDDFYLLTIIERYLKILFYFKVIHGRLTGSDEGDLQRTGCFHGFQAKS